MKTIIIFLIIFLISITGNTGLYSVDIKSQLPSNIFKFQNEKVPLDCYNQLINKPSAIKIRIFQNKIDDIPILNVLFDFHVVYKLPIDQLFSKVLNLNEEQKIFPRIIYSKDLNPEDGLWKPHFQEIKTQFTFSFYKENFNYIFYKIPIQNSDGSFLIKWNLYDSVDEKFLYNYGSWYMEEIIIDNQKYTYIRNYINYGMKKYHFYTELATNIGGANEPISFFNALKKATQ